MTTDDARPFLPPDPTDLDALRQAAQGCRGCDLYRNATQAVFGEGRGQTVMMLVGEQPGDAEDLVGRPFVGPAGRLLDKALEAVGIDRKAVYLTNAVKHFKWEPRGKRRIHSKPSAREVKACGPWLEAEIAALKPKVIVCLGATAAQALLGKTFSVTRQRGEFQQSALAPYVLATVHPSALLRIIDSEQRRAEMRRFEADLAKAAAVMT